MKILTKACVSMALMLMTSTMVRAAETNQILVYISQAHYAHSVHLLHPYYDYWFAQGPIVEPIALKALQAQYETLGLCRSGEKADTVVRITPNIFYNPQMRVYHAELQAAVYSGGGSLLGTYVGRAQQQGFISVDHGTQMHLKKVYALAMQDLMRSIKLDQDALARTEVRLPCNVVGAQVEPRINYY
jgi:hypothetical protein